MKDTWNKIKTIVFPEYYDFRPVFIHQNSLNFLSATQT